MTSTAIVPGRTTLPAAAPATEQRRHLRLVAGICLPVGLLCWLFFGAVLFYVPGQDFMVFQSAARAVLRGDVALLLDGMRFTAALNADYAAWLSSPLGLHPWVYPPPFLLVLLPFSLLPFGFALPLFLLSTFAALAIAIRLWAPSGRDAVILLVAVAMSPAAAAEIAVGQNAFLTTALLIGGLGAMTRFPLVGGALLGLLILKPQLCLMIPIALIATRSWQPLIAAAAAATLLALASTLLVGPQFWLDWLHLITGGDPQYQTWEAAGRLNGQSVFAGLRLLGASASMAAAGQDLAIVFSGAIVWFVFRSTQDRSLRLATLAAATFLAAPHVSNYDGLLVCLAAVILLCRSLRGRVRNGDIAIVVLAWMCPIICPPILVAGRLAGPLIVGVLLTMIAARVRAESDIATASDLATDATTVFPTFAERGGP